MPDKPEHFDVRDSDDLHATEWTPEIEVMIVGFDAVFLREAKKAADRAGEGLRQRDSTTVAGATAAAVLLAAAACEARLSEFITEHERELGATVQTIRETRRGQALAQWRELLSARAPAFPQSDSKDYQALGCLFKLRDLVAHRNARLLRLGEWPKELKDCVRQKAIPVTQSNEVDWTSGVYVHHVAVWAYETAANWLTTASSLGIASGGGP